ncbi:hypothetical protein PI126_g18900 [Phytophthora idaei]|nr:hypothetical protein PI126_g18900 [Phytophthora idaei]
MSTGIDFEVEGITTFDSLFAFSKERKGQSNSPNLTRQSGFLSKEEYVTAANAFVDASEADYVSCFQQRLDCSLDSRIAA